MFIIAVCFLGSVKHCEICNVSILDVVEKKHFIHSSVVIKCVIICVCLFAWTSGGCVYLGKFA